MSDSPYAVYLPRGCDATIAETVRRGRPSQRARVERRPGATPEEPTLDARSRRGQG